MDLDMKLEKTAHVVSKITCALHLKISLFTNRATVNRRVTFFSTFKIMFPKQMFQTDSVSLYMYLVQITLASLSKTKIKTKSNLTNWNKYFIGIYRVNKFTSKNHLINDV